MGELPENLVSHIRWVLFHDAKLSTLPVGVNTPKTLALVRYRKLFFKALNEIEPRVTRDLVTDHACELMRQFGIGAGYLRPDQKVVELVQDTTVSMSDVRRAIDHDFDRLLHSPVHRNLRETGESIAAHVLEWQQTYNLTDAWLSEAAITTLQVALLDANVGQTYNGPLILPYSNLLVGPHDRKAVHSETDGTLHGTETHEPADVPIYLNDLGLLDILDGTDGFIGTFDPRTETVAAASKRLLRKLKPRMDKLLHTIAYMDRSETGAERSISRSSVSFTRLARYQVLKESQPDIAYADQVDVSTVSQQVNDAAFLIALTLLYWKKSMKAMAVTLALGTSCSLPIIVNPPLTAYCGRTNAPSCGFTPVQEGAIGTSFPDQSVVL